MDILSPSYITLPNVVSGDLSLSSRKISDNQSDFKLYLFDIGIDIGL